MSAREGDVMAQVFFSYAREDAEAASRLAALVSAAGYSVWWDRKLLPHENFHHVIESELRDAAAVVVVWSEASIKSDWVIAEASEGRDLGKLIQVSLSGARAPLAFRALQIASIDGWDRDAPALLGVLASLEVLTRQRSPQPMLASTTSKAPRRFSRRLVAVAAVLLSAAAVGAWSMRNKTTPSITVDSKTLRRCDEYAGHFLDRTLPSGVVGRTIAEVRQEPVDALAACKAALLEAPDHPRMNYNYARALYANNRLSEAMPYIQKSVDAKHLRALVWIGIMYTQGEGFPQDFAKARATFVDLQDVESSVVAILARFSFEGIGEPANPEKALALDRESGEKGYNRSQYNLGVARLYGIGTQRDVEAASVSFMNSIQVPGRTPLAYTALGWIRERGMWQAADFAKARAHYEEGRKYKHRLASLALARIHALGLGTPKDLDRSAELLREAVSKEFDPIKDDTMWMYAWNPAFEELAKLALEDLAHAASANGHVGLKTLVEELRDGIAQRRIPARPDVQCADEELARRLWWCIQFVGQPHQ